VGVARLLPHGAACRCPRTTVTGPAAPASRARAA